MEQFWYSALWSVLLEEMKHMAESVKVEHCIEFTGKVAPSFKELLEIALGELGDFHGNAEILCGPMTTGGTGNMLTNLVAFNDAVKILREKGRPIWNQIPYEYGLALLEAQWRQETREYGPCRPIIDQFYRPLFDHTPRLIKRAWFIEGPSGWKTSRGAQWEHAHISKLPINIQYFKDAWRTKCVLPPNLD